MIIPKLKFPFYGIIIVSSIFIGMYYIYKSLKKDNVKDKNILLYFLLYIVFAIIFGKLYTFLTNPNENNILTAGLSAYGGLIGVVIGSIIFEKILPCDNRVIKYTILSLPLVYGLTKIACFIVGCCYGIPYNGFLSVTYTNGLNIPLFPIQALESITFIIIFIICNKMKNIKDISYYTLLVVSIMKFLLDFLRYDHTTKLITVNQIFSIILFIITLIVLIINKKANIKNKFLIKCY